MTSTDLQTRNVPLARPPQLDPVFAATLPDPILHTRLFLEGVARQGDLVAYPSGEQRRVLVNDPDLAHACLTNEVAGIGPSPLTGAARTVLREGLLTITDMQNWRPHRILIQREISYRNVRRHAEVFADTARKRIAGWSPGSVIDIQTEMARLTLDILGEAVFTTDFSSFRDLIRRAMQALIDVSTAIDTGVADSAARQELDAAIAELDILVQQMVAERRIEPASRNDIMHALIAAVDAGNPVFDDSWVRDEAVTLLVGGHDTSALTATMALYLLARHPEIAATLRADMQAALARGVPEAQLADEVALARHVVEETMRLYPPLPTLTRSVTEDITLGEFQIDAGTVLVFSPWVMQRDARFFANPTQFDPWRFAGERRKSTLGNAYFPFGAGPRICVGNHFALLEIAVIVATTTLHADLELLDPNEPVMAPLNSLRCRDGLPARVVQAQAAA